MRSAYPLVLRLQTVERDIRIPFQRRNAHQPNQPQRFGGIDLRADFVDGPGVGDVDTAAGNVPVEADLDVYPQRILPTALAQCRRRSAVEGPHHSSTADRM